jgi:CheY-like chemotaxis protein
MMGGEIQVHSQLGQGSTFSFNTRLQRANSTPTLKDKLLPSLLGQTALVVDDNASSRIILTQKLECAGLHAVPSDSAAHALHSPQLAQARFALIDVNMPDIDGYALATQLRKMRSAEQLAIIMMGALSEQISADELERLNIQSFLVKPVDPHELVDVLNKQHTAGNDATTAPHAGDQPASPLPQAQRVLLAEDTPINQTLQTILLNRMGYEVTIANNGLEAVEAFSSGTFDLILMDIQMPEMGGIEATQAIREREKSRQAPPTPIIAVTANALKGDREHYMACGMDGYVSKPISLEALKSEIQRLLRTPLSR